MNAFLSFVLNSDFIYNIFIGVIVAVTVTFLGFTIKRVYEAAKHAPLMQVKKVLIFVSTGGTCRDPMAKVIFEQENKKELDVEVHSVGVGEVTHSSASKAAQIVIEEMYGENLLKRHKSKKLNSQLVKRADLILCMEKSHVKTIEKNYPHAIGKTKQIKEFFGMPGEVVDPYSFKGDVSSETIDRYRHCAQELKNILTGNYDKLVKVLSV